MALVAVIAQTPPDSPEAVATAIMRLGLNPEQICEQLGLLFWNAGKPLPGERSITGSTG